MEKGKSSLNAILVRRARLLLVGATLLWGSSFALIRGLQLAQEARVPAISGQALACADMAIRFGLAALLLLPFYARNLWNITSREWSQAAGLALLAGPGLYLQTLGLAWTDASVSAFLTQLYTLLVPLIVAGRDRRWPTLRVALACTLVLLGVALLSPGLLTHFTLGPGELLIVISTFFFALQIVWVERPLYADNRSGVVTLVMFALIALLFAALYPFLGTAHSAFLLLDHDHLGILMLLIVIFCTQINYFIMNTWQRCISATEAGLIYCIEPVIATVLASFVPGWISRFVGIFYPNETLRWGLFLGGALIVSATVLVATQRPHDQARG